MDELNFARPGSTRAVIIAFSLVLTLLVCFAQDAPVFEGLGGVTDSFKTFKSSNGRYVVISNNRPEAASLSRWIGEVITRLEKYLGEPLPFDRSNYFHVIIYFKNNMVKSGVDFQIEERTVLDREYQSLIYYDYYNLKRERAMEGLCGLLLGSMVKKFRNAGGSGEEKSLPDWFIRGMSQNLFVTDRGRNSRGIYTKWKRGDIVTLSEILSSDGPSPDWDACGVMVGWLLSFRPEVDIVNKLISHVAVGGDVTKEWLSAQILPPDSLVDIDAKWDFWIFGQKNKVYELGRLDAELVAEMQAELLIYRGAYGTAWDSNRGESLTFGDLINLKDEEWVSGLCNSKIANIQLLGFGKAKEFMEVTVLYCDFLRALSQRKGKWRLKRMLNKADKAFAVLVDRFAGSDG